MEKQDKPSIRSAVGSDLDTVACLWRESALLMDGALRDVPSREALRKRVDAELCSGWDLRVAVVGERVVGFLAIKPAESVLDQIFVLPDQQGRGVGGALMEAAKQAMPGGFTLRMDAANEFARRFYEKQGMNLVAEGAHPSTGIPVHFYQWRVR